MQLLAMQTSLEPLPHRENSVGRRPFVSQTPEAPAAGTRANPLSSTSEDRRPPDSQGGFKQVARTGSHFGRPLPDVGDASKRHSISVNG
jgi:hypothetical protein